jgi:hypothetical protein
MQKLIAGLLCIVFSMQAQGEDSPTEQAIKFIAAFEDKIAQLGVGHLEALKAIDKEYLDETERSLKELIDSLEQSRKLAMERDHLDRALKYRSLIEKYSQWLDGEESTSTDTENSDAASGAGRKESAEIIFERKLAQANRERRLKEKRLVEALQKNADSQRQEVLEALDKLRAEAMLVDNLDEALSIRDQIEAIKSLDLSQPQFVEDDHETTEPEPVFGNAELLVAIQPVSNKTVQQSVEIPQDAKKIEVSFFSHATPEEFRYRHPGYGGLLRINGRLVVSFIRKYKWKDGKHYNYSIAFDGSEIDSRNPESLHGSYDITNLVTPGSQAVFSYRNRQKYPSGVRMYITK